MEERPLHVRVAEALGWTDCDPDAKWGRWKYGDCDCGMDEESVKGLGSPPWDWKKTKAKYPIPRYDTDWSATGPLIEKYRISLRSPYEPEYAGEYFWEAYWWDRADPDTEITKGGMAPLLAVCNLILALKEAGKL